MPASAAPVLETAGFTLSAFESEDDRGRLRRWLENPRIARGFAYRPAIATDAAVARWIAACDGRAAVLLAIRERGTGAALGFWHLRAAADQRRAEISVAIGEAAGLGRDAPVETGIALFDWIFAATSIEKLTAHVLERNRLVRVIISEWMELEGTLRDDVRAPDGGGRLTVMRYGLLRDDWLRRRNGVSRCSARKPDDIGKPE